MFWKEGQLLSHEVSGQSTGFDLTFYLEFSATFIDHYGLIYIGISIEIVAMVTLRLYGSHGNTETR